MREMIWLLLPAFFLVAAVTALDGPAPDLSQELNGQNLLHDVIQRADEAARERAYYGQTYDHDLQDASIPANSDKSNGRFGAFQTQTQQIATNLERSLRLFVDDIQQASNRLVASAWQTINDA